MATLILKKGRVQPVWAGHPWVYAQAVESLQGAPLAGHAVEVRDGEGHFLGRGFYSPNSAIVCRIATYDVEEDLDASWLHRRVQAALHLRARIGLPNANTNGYRLVHADGDGLPGLIVDVLGNTAVMQCGTLGMKLREDDIASALRSVPNVARIVSVASPTAAQKEGFLAETKLLRGEAQTCLSFVENAIAYEIDTTNTQKTGFYFDQRDNRARVASFSRGARVLDLYSYVGAFAFHAALGGAEYVLGIDSSPLAVTTASALAHRMQLGTRVEFARGDVREVMRDFMQKKRRFDVVVLDPPKLAPTIKSLDRARSAYRKLNADAVRLVEPGGILVTCSCSGSMQSDDFLRTVAVGIRDAGRHATLLHLGSQGEDHPVPLAFPEGRYLKAAFLRVL